MIHAINDAKRKTKSNANNQPLTILMTSDFICPWCFIAERRLQQAAAGEGIEIDIHFKPYELNPEMPIEGLNRKTYRSAKFGSWERSMQLDQGTIEASKDLSLVFDYEAIEFTPNTRAAHRLMWYTQQHAPHLQQVVADRVLEGYFSKGLNIGDKATLATIASDVGMNHDSVLAFLHNKEGEDEVITLEQQASRDGVRGVPHLQLGDAYVYGAESTANLRKALRKAVNQKKSDGVPLNNTSDDLFDKA